MENGNFERRRLPIPVEDFHDLKELLTNLCEDEITLDEYLGKIEIRGSSKRIFLLFKTVAYPEDTFIMSVLELEPSRKGIGSQILKWITEYTKKRCFKRLVFESIYSQSSINFARKHGFTQIKLRPEFDFINKINRDGGSYQLEL
ncbi:GNAT family N-acetyltransferase [Bacillus sp. FJAT-45350]|uniref:GNAT family N-acetyltransferase n=1 Tax=Bacillus sp. FJAT-45350 TaxID=2011014 RepID=UPI000BB94F91|nr:GNAT family N-acetyltransferase [Bacillus sp. FJAT-45350]